MQTHAFLINDKSLLQLKQFKYIQNITQVL